MSTKVLSEVEQNCLQPVELAVVEAARAFVAAFALIPDVVEIRFGPGAMEMLGTTGLTTLFKIRRVCGLELRWPEQPTATPRTIEVAVLDEEARWQVVVGVSASSFVGDER